MMRENTCTGCPGDAEGFDQAQCGQRFGDLFAASRHEHLLSRLQEAFYSVPRVGDEAGARPGGLKYTGRRGEAVPRHAVAVDVQRRARRAEETVVVGGPDVTEVADVGGHRLAVPAGAAEQGEATRSQDACLEKEFLDACLAISKPVTEKAEVACEIGSRRYRVMHFGIERVVDRRTHPCA